ncbi:LCP family protein [Alkalihalobacillus sp. LMS39]|uniref:LCP family glycopolymer transferase n=1 Tax=Alkalihalobacillus sp. LMS39 TaxID=2924032 RepID=UPI001FB261A5|nr:LCP family protein [Alkalihalobacillus sp. LMS39]UOE93817.1 LCP family protein [Alkalihalobacillus sp. LMS39]
MSEPITRRQDKKTTSKRKTFLKVLLLIGMFLFVTVGGTTAYFVWKLDNVATGSQQELERGDKSEKRTEAVNPSKDNISILLLGEDARPGETRARTDAIVVATFNKTEGSVVLTSIPRDSRVEIVGRDRLDKINHAHAYGGVDMTINTVEQFLDIPIDYFVKLNFQSFVSVVDALGGIEVEVPFTFEEKDTNNKWITLHEGAQTFNGEEALAYTRMRKHPQGGGDVGRGQRQQQVIEAMIHKAASLSSITRFDDVIDAVGENLQMNLSFGNIIALHTYAASLNNIEMLQIEGDNLMLDGIYYYEPKQESLEEIQKRLREHLQLDARVVYNEKPEEIITTQN